LNLQKHAHPKTMKGMKKSSKYSEKRPNSEEPMFTGSHRLVKKRIKEVGFECERDKD